MKRKKSFVFVIVFGVFVVSVGLAKQTHARSSDPIVVLQDSSKASSVVDSVVSSTIEPFPILTYDTDVGLGYGAKVFFLNLFGSSESFDIIAFNSTKGERWYRLVFSVPDFELRQGKIFPLAFDFTVDYDKYLKNNFYGIGNDTRQENRETYTKEPLEIQALLSRGFSRSIVGQAGVKYRTVRNFNYLGSGILANSPPALNQGRSTTLSLVTSFRYDSRNSFINPSNGEVVQMNFEAGNKSIGSDYTFQAIALSLQLYRQIFFPKTIVALRWMSQVIDGSDLPVHTLLSLGGNRTLRGSPQDRYIDKTAAVFNSEVRFPIYWRLGGVVGMDAGKVWSSLGNFDFDRWATSPVIGLRLYMDTFVVRADLGFGKETTGFYLNFGQLF